MRLTRIHQIAARMGDLAETRAFYQDILGARYVAEFEPPGLLFFEFSGVRIVFETNNAPAVIYFWVDDIDAAYQGLKSQGIAFEGEPHLIHRDDTGVFDNPGTEEWMAFFKDPGGNTLALTTRQSSG